MENISILCSLVAIDGLWRVENMCLYFGCIYNEDGICKYDESDIKIPFYCACYDEAMEDCE